MYVKPGDFVRHASWDFATDRLVVGAGSAHKVSRVEGKPGSELIYTEDGIYFNAACCIPCNKDGSEK